MHGLVQVIVDKDRSVRLLRSDHSIIGAQFLADGSAAFAFVDILAAVRFLRPQAKEALAIGLGAGSLAMALGKNALSVEVVEIDPNVVSFAERYFGYAPNASVHLEDARTFLSRTARRYDIIVHDTFTGGATPSHLLSLEVIQRLRVMLRPGGVLALNFVGYYAGKEAEGSFAVARTMRAVFPIVRVYRDGPLTDSEKSGNLIFFASEAQLDFRIPDSPIFGTPTPAQIQRSFQAWEVLRQVPPGPLVTDARNPLELLQEPLVEPHFIAMNQLLPRSLWLQ
jgi:precorrin-6B methylase 2